MMHQLADTYIQFHFNFELLNEYNNHSFCTSKNKETYAYEETGIQNNKT